MDWGSKALKDGAAMPTKTRQAKNMDGVRQKVLVHVLCHPTCSFALTQVECFHMAQLCMFLCVQINVAAQEEVTLEVSVGNEALVDLQLSLAAYTQIVMANLCDTVPKPVYNQLVTKVRHRICQRGCSRVEEVVVNEHWIVAGDATQ